jgi:hypothetical protein
MPNVCCFIYQFSYPTLWSIYFSLSLSISVFTSEKSVCLLLVNIQDRDVALRKGSMDSMPFPPGVGGGRAFGDANINSYEVITADKAIDESNVGNRMLRNMGWHEGSVSFPSLNFE